VAILVTFNCSLNYWVLLQKIFYTGFCSWLTGKKTSWNEISKISH